MSPGAPRADVTRRATVGDDVATVATKRDPRRTTGGPRPAVTNASSSPARRAPAAAACIVRSCLHDHRSRRVPLAERRPGPAPKLPQTAGSSAIVRPPKTSTPSTPRHEQRSPRHEREPSGWTAGECVAARSRATRRFAGEEGDAAAIRASTVRGLLGAAVDDDRPTPIDRETPVSAAVWPMTAIRAPSGDHAGT